MHPQEFTSLHILHVLSVIGLVGTIFYACAGALERRKKLLMWSGVASALVFLTGFRLWQGAFHFAGGWVIVKIVCWLALSALAGIAYRRQAKAGLWITLALALTALALVMVYLKPF